MDPRLSPNLTPQPKTAVPAVPHPSSPPVSTQPQPQPTPVQQTHTAQPAPANSHNNSVEQPMVPQLVEAFPVKQQEVVAGPPEAVSSVSPAPVTGSNPIEQPDNDLDKILRDVNNKVKAPEQDSKSKKKKLGRRFGAKDGQPKEKTTKHKPIGPVIAVVMVALMLSATAVIAYREGNRTATAANQPSKVGTSSAASSSIQEAGGKLVNPADLDDYAQTLQTKLNSLNDSQDFTSNGLSDQTLGL